MKILSRFLPILLFFVAICIGFVSLLSHTHTGNVIGLLSIIIILIMCVISIRGCIRDSKKIDQLMIKEDQLKNKFADTIIEEEEREEINPPPK